MTETITAYWFGCEDKQGRVYSPNAPRTKWVPGQSRTLKGEIIPCQRGYHASPSLWQALTYAPGPVACRVELSGEIIPHNGDKFAASTRKLIAAVNVDKDLRLFAADCAEHVLYLFEREYPNDDRPRKAIQAARDFAEGRISAAARATPADAAWNAARAAWNAGAAARAAAAGAAGAAEAAARVAAEAARDAAAAADADAAWAARAAEKDWQLQQFEARFAHIFDGATNLDTMEDYRE